MGDVGNGVFELAIAQRPRRPVGETGRLVDPRAGQLRHQAVVSDLIAEPADHRRDLRVEDRRRQASHAIEEYLQILPCRVKHLQDPGVRHEIVKGRQVDAIGKRIDRARAVRARQLDQAQLRPIGLLAHELGIDGYEGLRREPPTNRRDRGRIGDQAFVRGHDGGHSRCKPRPGSSATVRSGMRVPMAEGYPNREVEK